MNKVKKTRKKITALLLTGCLCVAMLGSYVLASTEYKVVSGDGGTYVKGSGEDYPLVIEGSIKDFSGVDVNKSEITRDQDYTVTGEVPETTEAPTTEVTETTETTTTEVTETTETTTTEVTETTETTETATTETSTTEVTDSTEGSNEDSNGDSNEGDKEEKPPAVSSLFGAKQVQAATITVTVTLKSSYLETLSAGTHEITINFEDGSAVATLNIEDPEATTEDEDTTEEEDTTEATTADDGKGDSPDQTTKSDSSKTGDSTPIGIFLALAVCSGAVIVYFGRKKVTK